MRPGEVTFASGVVEVKPGEVTFASGVVNPLGDKIAMRPGDVTFASGVVGLTLLGDVGVALPFGLDRQLTPAEEAELMHRPDPKQSLKELAS